MQLSEFSLTPAGIELGAVFQAIETVIPAETINQAIESTQSQEERNRRLPTHLVVGSRDCHEFVVERFHC